LVLIDVRIENPEPVLSSATAGRRNRLRLDLEPGAIATYFALS
jgi:hypothetical protein